MSQFTEGFESMQRMMKSLGRLDLFPDRKFAHMEQPIEGSHAPYYFQELLPAPRICTRVYVGEPTDVRNNPYEEPNIDIPIVVFDLRPNGTFFVNYKGPWPDGTHVNYKGIFNSRGDPLETMAQPIYHLLNKSESTTH